MPSHTFTRVGYWKDAVGSNLAAVGSAKASPGVGHRLVVSGGIDQDFLINPNVVAVVGLIILKPHSRALAGRVGPMRYGG